MNISSAERCWACTPPGSVRHSWARLSRIPTRYRTERLILLCLVLLATTDQLPDPVSRFTVSFVSSCPYSRSIGFSPSVTNRILMDPDMKTQIRIHLRNENPAPSLRDSKNNDHKRSFMMLRFGTFLLEG
jgi:hypothetical protein